MTDSLFVRSAVAGDLPAITSIYNHYVLNSHCTFDIVPCTVEERRTWMEQYGSRGRHRLLVATLDGEVCGYATSSRLRPKPAYETSVEVSAYCRPDRQRMGLGALLYEALFRALSAEDIHRAYAGVALPNPASLSLHHRFGFAEIGCFHEVGRKFGRYWDVLWLEKVLDSE